MALGRQVYHLIRIALLHCHRSGLRIGQVHLQQLVALPSKGPQFCHGLLDKAQIAGIGQLVEVEQPGTAAAEPPAHHGAADEAGAAGHQQPVDAVGNREGASGSPDVSEITGTRALKPYGTSSACISCLAPWGEPLRSAATALTFTNRPISVVRAAEAAAAATG